LATTLSAAAAAWTEPTVAALHMLLGAPPAAPALAALGDQEFVARSRNHNATERQRLADAIAMLGNHGITASPSEANFLLVHFDGTVTAAQALEALSDAGYAVRHLPSQGLPNSLRITIGTTEATSDVIATLRQLCGEAA
jgi:histidinol-phosphate aminotransferase